MHVIICIIGIFCGWIMFKNLPRLTETECKYKRPSLSVIIPARNEEKNLKLLLSDLMKQTEDIQEIICVDDGSSDNTAKVATSFDVTLLSITQKPNDWIGKSYACQKGADTASGELLLFLDADVRLKKRALQKLYMHYTETKTVITIQPFHAVKKWYEQLCFFFNAISIGALGINRVDASKTSGLFGPLILIPKTTYVQLRGHEAVKDNILEDMALGELLDQASIPYTRLIGGKDIKFRMYPDGIQSLSEGFIKNFAAGAMSSSLKSLVFVIVWVSALCNTAIGFMTSFHQGGMEFTIYAIFYIIFVIELLWIAKNIGSFKLSTIIFYPISLLFFIYIFIISLYKKVLKRPVKWKGRKI